MSPLPTMADSNKNSNNLKSILGSFKSRFGRKPDENGEASSSRGISADSASNIGTVAVNSTTNNTTSPAAAVSETIARGRALSASYAAANAAANAPPRPLAELPAPTPRSFRNEPPPSYREAISTPTTTARRVGSPTPSNTSNASRITIDDVSTAEDPYAFLTTFDTVFVIDDSGSMAGRSWREVQAVLANITPICTAHDADGIDIYFLNHRTSHPAAPGKASAGYHNVRDAATVRHIFDTVRPQAATPMGTRIHTILRPYLRRYESLMRENDGEDPEVKPVNMIVITDGVPTDDLEGVLLSAARKLDGFDAPSYQVGIQFFQVGNEPGAGDYLRDLDDNLCELVRGGVRDMVDTVTWDAHVQRRPAAGAAGAAAAAAGAPARTSAGFTADGILKVVLGAVVKRLDRQPSGPTNVNVSVRTTGGAAGTPDGRRFLAVP